MSHERCTRPDGNKGCIDCVAYGAVEEQERIIKLLEAERDKFRIVIDDSWFVYEQAIALIKGEKKQTGQEFDYFETPLEGENK
jgi:hypothetical protein